MHQDIKDMIGVTMMACTGAEVEDEMVFTAEDGRRFIFYHAQECCESVAIEDVVGDLSDLVGAPILVAEEVSSDNPEGERDEYGYRTWTFYRFATVKGTVTVRWLGESNGYYSESVDFRIEEKVES